MAVKIRQLVDTSFVARKKVFLISGDGATVSFVIDHGLNNQFPDISVVEAFPPYAVVWPDPFCTGANSCSITFGNAPAIGQDYRVSVTG